MCRFIETIRIECGRLYHIEAHQQRMDRTRNHFFAGSKPIDLKQLLLPDNYHQRTRCRVEYDAEVLNITYTPYTIRPVKSLRCIEANDLIYDFKKTDRSAINHLFDQKQGADDVLIVRDNLLTDTSICNIALWDGNRWITPATPLLQGTMREKLLQEGIIHSKDIKVDNLKEYLKIRLFNAMIDFGELELPVDAIRLD